MAQTLWPDSQAAWHRLAADCAARKEEETARLRQALAEEETADYYLFSDPPLSLEEEEML